MLLLLILYPSILLSKTSIDLSKDIKADFKGVSLIKGALNECHLFVHNNKWSNLNSGYQSFLSAYSADHSLYHLIITYIGGKLLSKYEFSSEKDICFLYIEQEREDIKSLVLKLPITEIERLSSRDFGAKDAALVSNLKARPYHKPPYPLINIFKKSSLFELIIDESDSTGNHLLFNPSQTNKYNEFLKQYQFPKISIVNESSVEDVYSVYLNMAFEVYNCIYDADLKCIKSYKDMGFSFDKYPPSNEPIIHSAIRADNSEIIDYLLNSGIDVNVKDSNGLTPLMLSAALNKSGYVVQLLERGANANYKTAKGALAIDFSKYNKFDNITKILSPETSVLGLYNEDEGRNSLSRQCATLSGNYLSYNACLGNVDALMGYGNNSAATKALYITQGNCGALGFIDDSGMIDVCKNQKFGCVGLTASQKIINECSSCNGSNQWLRVYATGTVLACY